VAFDQDTFSFGIDLGGTSLRVALFDSGIKLMSSHRLSTRVADGPDAVIADMADCVRSLLHAAPPRHHLLGIGIGSPGPLNFELGTLGTLPNFPGWDGFPLRDSLQQATGLPVYLENDANAAAAAEWKMGAGKTAMVDNLAVITIGTGLGSGLILDGRIWHGMVGMGGELGHASIDRNGPACGCGSRGCLETYASAQGLLRLARAEAQLPHASQPFRELMQLRPSCTPRDIAHLAEAGDASARRSFEQLGEYLGFGLASLISTLDLPLIVVGGGVATAWDLFAPAMFTAIHCHSLVYRLGAPTQRHTMEHNRTFIRPAELGPSAGLLGAALLPALLGPTGRNGSATGTDVQ
jgi:glucokinase